MIVRYHIGRRSPNKVLRVLSCIRILVAIVTHVRRITYMPDLNWTFYCCVSWCTDMSHNTVSVRVLAGIVAAIARQIRRITYTPKLTLTSLIYVILCYMVHE